MSRFTLVETIPVKNILGECILWDERSASVWWTDIHAAKLYQYAPKTGALHEYPVPERLCSFGLVEDDSRLICAFETGFALYDPRSGDLDWRYRPEKDFRGTRFNDGRVDRQGRFWSGTMVEGEARDGEGKPASGSLYWISAGGHSRVLGDIEISNSLAFSPEGTTLYFTDSPTRRIRAFELDPRTGRPGPGRIFAELSGEGAPDGSTVDAEGFLWNAQWGGSRVVRYSPGGAIDAELGLAVTQPTCVCFGGGDLDLLFVSSAREGLGAERLRAEPRAGDVFVYETSYRGLTECRFRL